MRVTVPLAPLSFEIPSAPSPYIYPDPSEDLAKAIEKAPPGSTVIPFPGTYHSGPITLPVGMTLYGPGVTIIPTFLGEPAVTGLGSNAVRHCTFAKYRDAVRLLGEGPFAVDDCRFYEGGRRAIWVGSNSNVPVGVRITKNWVMGIDGEDRKETQGIIVFGEDVHITENRLRDIRNATMRDCEGIYTKARDAIVTDNILKDAGGWQGSIAIKGHVPLRPKDGAYGDHGLCRDNIIRFTESGRRGIYLANDCWMVKDNLISGASVGVAVTTKPLEWVNVVDNEIHALEDAVQFIATGSGAINKTNVVVQSNILDAPNKIVVRHTQEDGGQIIPMPRKVNTFLEGNVAA